MAFDKENFFYVLGHSMKQFHSASKKLKLKKSFLKKSTKNKRKKK